jgi:hypothetical protein
MAFSQVSGGGPESTPSRTGRERAALAVLDDVGVGDQSAPVATPGALAAVRQALAAWGVTTVVVPTLSGQPLVVAGGDSRFAAGFMTDVLGRRPVYTHHAWVWSGRLLAGAALDVPASAIAACTSRAELRHRGPGAVPACVEKTATGLRSG